MEGTTSKDISNTNIAARRPQRIVFGFMQLQQLANGDQEEILKTFTSQSNKLSNTINNPIVGDCMVLFVKCLSRMSGVNLDSKQSIYLKTFKSPFVDHLINYINHLPFVRIVDKRFNMLYWDNVDEFWLNLLKVFDHIMNTEKDLAYERFSVLLDVCGNCIEKLRELKEVFCDEILDNFGILQFKLALTMDEYYNNVESNVTTMGRFRNMKILPSIDELEKGMDMTIQSNIIEGTYRSPEHYMETQFTLMREDYVAAVRESIMSYKKQHSSSYIGGCFHQSVKFVGFDFTRRYAGVVVHFTNAYKKNIKIFDKRFMYGSVLYFSDDHFSTYFYGTVVEVSDDLLTEGKIIVEFHNDIFSLNISKTTFVMFESDVYFVKYGSVLNALKNMKVVPMYKYIGNLEIAMNIPKYLPSVIDVDNHMVKLSENVWPSSTQLGLNEDQMLVFKMALTKEFVAIQGPPGTGKTFLGLKILKTILKNMSFEDGPVLILCYTNYALDKFLSGVLKLTENVIRVGGQSKDKRMDMYNLQQKRNQSSRNNSDLDDKVRNLRALQFAYDAASDDTMITDIKHFECHLKDFNMPEHIKRLADKANSYLVNWLLVTDDREFLNKRYNLLSNKLADANVSISPQMAENNYITENLACDDTYGNIDVFESLSLIDSIHPLDRWRLYRSWNNKLKTTLMKKILILKMEFDSLKKNNDLQTIDDLAILKKARVIGMTTTGAANSNELVRALSPKIVIVEEAAEILESHIVANLTEYCEHLIMLGDHQQLRPTTANYIIGEKYNLQISLFERLFKNNNNCFKLTEQYRMRPEISKLLYPSIYKHLSDNDSVTKYSNLRGVQKNLFFIDHEMPEEQDNGSTSYRNTHEANFSLKLAAYFIQQKYSSEDITILVTYSEQLFYMKEIIKDNMDSIKDVRVCVLDGFQGDESDIIILSLVRSNAEGSVGFLNSSNRISVALSRARKGLYIIGNMALLKYNSELWQKIDTVLENQNSIGASLSLWCENHNYITSVKCGKDFIYSPFGGCLLKCNALLPCGHRCQDLCHNNTRHEGYKCQLACKLKCINGHGCNLKCHEKCYCLVIIEKKLSCGHKFNIECGLDPMEVKCLVVVNVNLKCSHQIQLPCFMTKGNIKCTVQCLKPLCCGHICLKECHKFNDPDHIEYKCYEPCNLKNLNCNADHKCSLLCMQKCIQCNVMVTKKHVGCNHSSLVRCCDFLKAKCEDKCGRQLNCGHLCQEKCSKQCGNCAIKVEKLRSCGHSVTTKCCNDIEQEKCTSRCELVIKCGHRCADLCGEKCGIVKCIELIENKFPSICGHKFEIPCSLSRKKNISLSYLSNFCRQPCHKILECCAHPCVGKCNECRGCLHSLCGAECGKRLICGHICFRTCSDACNMCEKPCEKSCQHSECTYKCGIPCVPCTENCERRTCEHQTCDNQCNEVCSVSPCSKPCTKPLLCQHSCIGFCGDVCPNICQICNADKMPAQIFENKYNETSRYIQLLDCCHAVEVNDLDQWIESQCHNSEIIYPNCPYCKTPILNSSRYFDYILSIRNDIETVKKIVYGEPRSKLKEFQLIIEILDNMNDDTRLNYVFKSIPSWKKIIDDIKNQIILNNINAAMIDDDVRIGLCEMDMENFISKINIFITCSNIFKRKFNNHIESDIVIEKTTMFLKVLATNLTLFSTQQAIDFNSELYRLSCLVDFNLLSPDAMKKHSKAMRQLSDLLMSYGVFDERRYDTIKKMCGDLFCESGSDEKNIFKAINLKQGTWFKCIEGHIYCIRDCGLVTDTADCPECKNMIDMDQNNKSIGEVDKVNKNDEPLCFHFTLRK